MTAIVDRDTIARRASSSFRLGARRTAVAVVVIGAYIAVGFAFRLSADAYLLLGIPITVAFQALVARQPLRALWLRAAPPFRVTRRSLAAFAVVAIAPAYIAISGAQTRNATTVAYGVVCIAGAFGAANAVASMDRAAVLATVRATIAGAVAMAVVMVTLRLATGGFHGNVLGAVTTSLVSLATYVPAVFVIEEVLFRGALDPYLYDGNDGGRAAAVVGSGLWGLWHLPVAGVALGVLTVPYLVGFHVLVGYALVAAWRRTANLAAPGIAHALIDAFRNAIAVL